VSLNPNRSKQATIASLVRRARYAEAAGRILETIDLLREVAELDPGDRRTMHHLGDIFRLRLNRMSDAATWYARAARALERDDLPIRAIAVWRIVLQCNPLDVEAHERVGALYVETGRLGDARVHWARSERILQQAGLGRDAAILRAQREAIEPALPEAPAPVAPDEPPSDPLAETTRMPALGWLVRPAPAADVTPGPLANAAVADLVAERVDTGRSFLHYGVHSDARRVLEEALALAPDHVEARELLAQVCRELDDASAATYHLDMLAQVMRKHGQAAAAAAAGAWPVAGAAPALDPAAMTIVMPAVAPLPAEEEPLLLPPFEEWGFATDEVDEPPPGDEEAAASANANPFADLMDDVRKDVTRLIERVRDE